MGTQYEYATKAEAVAQKQELERLGATVFTPYYQPRILFQNGKHITLKWGTWNLIFIRKGGT